MIEELRAWAEARGYKLAWGDASAASAAREGIAELRLAGEVDKSLYDEQLATYVNPPEAAIGKPRSVIMIAVPRPAHRLRFELGSGELETILPPTYVTYRGTYAEVISDLRESVIRGRQKSELLQAPLKATAVQLGLAKYGRNNITYVEGLGSYFQLVGVLTDAELPEPAGGIPAAPAMSPLCENCGICIDACPTGAIEEERFLLHAERCFTLANELSEPWPEWIKPALERCFSAEPCVIGCLRCQSVCPMNSGRLKVVDAGVSFSAEETEMILSGRPCSEHLVCLGIMEKLDQIGRGEDFISFGRNLREVAKRRL